MIRQATKQDAATVAKIRIDNWRTTYKGLLPQSFLDDLDYDKETANWLKFIETDNCLLYVATDENDDVLGFVGNKIHTTESPKIGEIYALHTPKAHRGKGVGKALIHFSAKLFKSQNINQMQLWVVVGNMNAIEIYEHLGAVIYTERVDIINGVNVPEIGMKWLDITAFLDKMTNEKASLKTVIKRLNAKQYVQSNTIELTNTEQQLIDKYSPNNVLVVYGSLAPNESNFSVVEHIKGEWKKGIIQGKLYKIGWGAYLGYWGFKHVPKAEQEEIPAHILFSDELPHNWQMLDDFEGDGYQRVLIDFELENGEIGVGCFYKLR